MEDRHDDHLSSRHMVPALTSASAAKCSSHTLGLQPCVDVLVSVDDKRRPGGHRGLAAGVLGGSRAGGCRGKVGGTRAPEGRKEKSREYSHYPPRAIPLWPISCWRP